MQSRIKLSHSAAALAATIPGLASADTGSHGALEFLHFMTSFHHAGAFWLALGLVSGGYMLLNHKRVREQLKVRVQQDRKGR